MALSQDFYSIFTPFFLIYTPQRQRDKKMAEPIKATNKDITEVTTKKVHCDGPEFSKHPRVYLNMGDENTVVCPYCSHVFKLKK